jgi:antitoxin (DNA-binding transcriptional repressor) of toxin-antitoxin stability system
MDEIGVRELRQQASRYLKRVAAGESFVITDYGKPVAVLAATMEAVRSESEAVIQSLVDAGIYTSVETAIADDTEQLVARARQRVLGDAIVAGYRRQPQSDVDVSVARSAGVRAIAAEPW